jgi:UDP-glucose:(heptosyl)LPS alpha-1,3-glucosyltransferase
MKSASPAAPARIAVMLPRFSRYGGVEQFAYRLCAGLAARGHAVDMICARQEVAAPPGVRVLPMGRPRGFRWLKLLCFLVGAERLRRRGGYDLALSLGKNWNQDLIRMGGGPLHIFWEKSERALAPGLPRLLKRLKRRLSPVNWLILLVERRQFRQDSRVIAVSHLVRDWLLQAHKALRPEKVSVVYNRPDSARFSPPAPDERAALRERLWRAGGGRLPEDALCIGTACTNFQLKGVGPLIRAMALLPENAVLFVAGGRDSAAYVRLAASLGLGDRVRFLGKVEAMPDFYKALDIFILPTFYDACSNAVLEALACGCKTLTSADNGAAHFLEAEAVFPDPGDAEALADRLKRFAARPAPGPFRWPEDAPCGLEDFMDAIEAALPPGRCRKGA